MMPIESQVVSPDLANRLAVLGVKQESHFVWAQGISDRVSLFVREECHMPKRVAAFTVAELGEMLRALPYLKAEWMPNWDGEGMWSYAGIKDMTVLERDQRVCDITGVLTEANARGEMIVRLIEINRMKV